MNKRASITVCSLLLALALPSVAQVKVGDNLSLKLAGDVAFGYTSNYSSIGTSGNGMSLGGDLNLNGSFYDPRFLSFSIQPFYNQSRDNSDSQSITSTTGVSSSVSLFGGSRFPGSINYSKFYNSEGQFSVPGLPNITTHGDSDAFSINWGANLENLPSLSVGFSKGASNYSIYGANADGSSRSDSFTAASTYSLAGFNLNANYRYTGTTSDNPQVFTNQGAQTSNSSGDSLSFGVGHKLPLHGTFSASASRADITASLNGVQDYSGTINTGGAGVALTPLTNLGVGVNAIYTDNLAGTLFQGASASGVLVQPLTDQSSDSLGLTTYANYQIPRLHLSLFGNSDYRSQTLFGISESSTSSMGDISYANNLLGGFLTALAGVNETSTDKTNQTQLGLIASLGYSREILGWKIAGSGSYSQNQETALVAYTSSSYGFSGSVGRKFGKSTHWGASAAGSKTELNSVAGAGTLSQSYSTLLSTRHYGLSGGYSKSSGNSILTNTGLASTTVPLPVLLPTSVILYGGHSISVGASASLVRGLTMAVTYSKSSSNTVSNSIGSSNSTDQVSANVNYLFRKMMLRGGYSRLVQGFSVAGTPPSMVGSYYIGVSRWFNFF